MSLPVTAVVVNYRTARQTSDLVEQLVGEYRGISVLVLDNSEQDAEWAALEERLGRLSAVDLSRAAHNLGFAAGVNRLLGRVETDWALLLNPDLLALPAIERLLAVADSHVAAVGPLVLDDSGMRTKGTYGGGPSWKTLLGYALPLPGVDPLFGAPPRDSRPRDVGWVSGACMLVNLGAWRGRPFDESLFMYAEDIDYCWAQRAAGRRVVLQPTVRVQHRAGGSSGGRPPVLWASNLAAVSSRYVTFAPGLLTLGLIWRGLLALAGHPAHGRYLLASARAAWRGSARYTANVRSTSASNE